MKRKSIFKNIKSIHGLLFEIYKAIPFYYPIKNVVDWTFTRTSLDLFDWFRFESIYDEIFRTYRIKYPNEKKPVGKAVKKRYKITMGGITSFFLLSFLVLPLIIFSSLNPANEKNNITSAEMKVYLSFINNNRQEKNYLIFENSWAENIVIMSKQVKKNYGYEDTFYTGTFPDDQIQVVSFYNEPENSLSEFKLSHINSSLESLLSNYTQEEDQDQEQVQECNLILETNFIRPLPNEAKNVKYLQNLFICSRTDITTQGCKGLNDTYNFFKSVKNDSVMINITSFSPLVRLTASPDPQSIEKKKEYYKTINIQPSKKDNTYSFGIYFDCDGITNKQGIQFHVFNEKISSTTSGYSVIGFYSAFVLVIGTYVSKFFIYNPEKIIIGEMPRPEKLLNLCECVKISRYSYDFRKEEYLFNILIEILRTPDFVKKLTQSTIEQFQRRTALSS